MLCPLPYGYDKSKLNNRNGQVKLALLHLKDTIANNMANEQNLKPQNTRTKSERRKIAQKGGIASGKALLAKKTASEYAIAALEATTKGKDGNLVTIVKCVCKLRQYDG